MVAKRTSILALLLIAALVLAACPQPEPIAPAAEPAADQEEEAEVDAAPEAGEAQPGGVFVWGSGDDPSILNPILSSGTNSSDVHQFFYPELVDVDPFSGAIIPDLAESWSVSEDGLIWTFTLRDDVQWSDGESVDGEDFKFTYDAIASELVETPRKSNVEYIADIQVPDPQTVVITFTQVKCDALFDLALGILPSHKYAADFSDIMTSPENEAPTVSAGPFVFNEWSRDERVTMLRNETYVTGAPFMEGMIYKEVPDVGARLAQFQTGEVDRIDVQPQQLTTVQMDPNLEIFKYEDDGYSYIGLNLANPENPQPGLDEEGNPIQQDPHPILSDKNVRKAIAHALDYQTIIDQVYLGQGYPLAANVLPAVEWAYNEDVQPYAYDPDLAAQFLEDAGWVDSDGDGVREKDGQTLSLTLVTNSDNATRVDLGTIAQDQLNSIGFDVAFEAIEFGTLVEQLLGQTFDMVIIGWTSIGSDPNDENLWARQYDSPGGGFNFVSLANDRMEELLQAGITVPGCGIEDRAPYYKEIQEIIHEEIPYVFIRGDISNEGFAGRWQGIDAGPWDLDWDVNDWYLSE